MTLVNEKTVAELLNVSIRTVQRLADAGAFPRYKIGRLIRYDAETVQRYIDGAVVSLPQPVVRTKSTFVYTPGMKVV